MIGKFILDKDEVMLLAALQLLVEYQSSKDLALKGLESNLREYIPMKMINYYPSMFWTKNIYEIYLNQLKEFSTKTFTKLKYIKRLRSSHLWEAHQFIMKVDKALNSQ